MLKWALRANALFSAASGLVLVSGSYLIAPRLGIDPSWTLLIVGLGLLPFAVDLFINSGKGGIDISKVKVAVAGDIAWIAGSVAVIVIDPTGLTTVGVGTVGAVAAVVGNFAILQWIGLKRAQHAYFREAFERPSPK